MSSSSIQVARENNQIFLKIIGKGNFLLGQLLKDFYTKHSDNHQQTFYIDMSGCQSMDSTFMGVLAGIGKSLREKTGLALNILNLSEHNYELLNTLGIDIFLNLESGQKVYPAQFANLDITNDKNKLKTDILEAHHTLMHLSEANHMKFKDVYEYLKSSQT